MTSSIRRKSIATILVVGAIAPVAPASAAYYESLNAGPQSGQGDDSSAIVVRRDGAAAVPFVAQVGPETTAPAPAADGFDWGDAAIGAGAGLVAASLAMLGSAAVGRRSQRSKPPTAVSQQA